MLLATSSLVTGPAGAVGGPFFLDAPPFAFDFIRLAGLLASLTLALLMTQGGLRH